MIRRGGRLARSGRRRSWDAPVIDPHRSLTTVNTVCIQAWSRDAAAPTGGNLTDAVAFLIDP